MNVLDKINALLMSSKTTRDYRLGLIDAINIAYNGNVLIKFRHITKQELPEGLDPGIDSSGKLIDDSRIQFYYMR